MARSRPLSVVFLALFCFSAAAAGESPIGEIEAADRAVVEALALYDESLRRDALEAVTEADVLADLVGRQQHSSATFRQLLEPYDRPVQEDLFELARYPELVAEIAEGGPKSQADLDAIAFRYPQAVADAAARSGREHWKLVARTHALMRDEEAAFEATIAHLPERKRDAFRALLATPDLLVLLAENTGVAVLLGDAYERRPDDVLAWLDDVDNDASQRGAQETRELAEAVKQDAELAEEIAASAEDYEQVTGQSAYPQPQSHVSVNVTPYPYWVGHPWWYAASYPHYDPWYYWYPNLAWSFGGVHFGPRFHASVGFGFGFGVGLGFGVGWPHGAFWGWYFDHPGHHSRYPRLTHHVVRHYERYAGPRHHSFRHRGAGRFDRRYARPGAHAVHRFVNDSGRSMPRGFLRDDGRRVERFREYGRLHQQGRRNRDPLRQVRADRERYPRLARLSGDPQPSRAERRDRQQTRRGNDERRAARRAESSEPRREQRAERDERRNARVEKRPERSERRNARVEKRPERSERRNARVEKRPERSERRNARVEKRPERSERRNARVEQRPERSERRNARVEQRPDRSERRNARVEQRPERSERRNARVEQRPDRSERRVERAERRVERSAGQRSGREARRPQRQTRERAGGGRGGGRGRAARR